MVADSDASALFSAAFTSTGRGHISVITDGPYLETKEHIGGFWVLEAVDLDERWSGGARPPSPVGRPSRCVRFTEEAPGGEWSR